MSQEFISAARNYFGLPPSAEALISEAGTIAFQIPLTAADLAGILKRMAVEEEERLSAFLGQQDETQAWADSPAVADVIRDPGAYIGKPGMDDVVARAAKLSKKVREALAEQQIVGSVAQYFPEQNEGVGGRKVAHVDVPEAEEDSALPAAVWVRVEDITLQQRMHSSDQKGEKDQKEYMVQVAMLTDEQKAKYGVVS